MSRPIIEVDNLSKAYLIGQQKAAYLTLRDTLARLIRKPVRLATGERREREEIWALNEVSFEVNQGEVVGIIGRNGSGKSTLLKILSRIVEPTSGRAILRGGVASLLEVGTGFHPELSGRENVYLNGAMLGMSRWEIRRKFDEIAEFSGVEKFLDTPVKFYSSGMYVRLAFAVAAHLDPDILIVDEVLAVGDAEFQKKSLGKMSEVASEGRTVLFVSHSMHSVQQLCSRVVYLDRGSVEASGETGTVVERYLRNQGTTGTRSSLWENNGAHQNPFFVPEKFCVADGAGTLHGEAVSKESEAWVRIEGEILNPHPELTIGYALYDETGTLLYWSYPTDVPKRDWASLRKGRCTFRSKIPLEILNEGSYRLECISSIHYKEWLFEPGVSAPTIQISLQGPLSRSPFWKLKRPGSLAPVLRWEVEQ